MSTKKNSKAKSIHEMSHELHPAFYLTLVSISQSLAFGYLLLSFRDLLMNNVFSIWLSFLAGIATFMLIVLVWYEYAMGTLCFKWILGYWDSFIPFLFGIAQFALIHSIITFDYSLWFNSLAFFTFIAYFAYLNQYYRSKKEKNVNKEVLDAVGKNPLKTLIITILYMALFCCMGEIARLYEDRMAVLLFLLIIANVMILGFSIRSWRGFQRIFFQETQQ